LCYIRTLEAKKTQAWNEHANGKYSHCTVSGREFQINENSKSLLLPGVLGFPTAIWNQYPSRDRISTEHHSGLCSIGALVDSPFLHDDRRACGSCKGAKRKQSSLVRPQWDVYSPSVPWDWGQISIGPVIVRETITAICHGGGRARRCVKSLRLDAIRRKGEDPDTQGSLLHWRVTSQILQIGGSRSDRNQIGYVVGKAGKKRWIPR